MKVWKHKAAVCPPGQEPAIADQLATDGWELVAVNGPIMMQVGQGSLLLPGGANGAAMQQPAMILMFKRQEETHDDDGPEFDIKLPVRSGVPEAG